MLITVLVRYAQFKEFDTQLQQFLRREIKFADLADTGGRPVAGLQTHLLRRLHLELAGHLRLHVL